MIAAILSGSGFTMRISGSSIRGGNFGFEPCSANGATVIVEVTDSALGGSFAAAWASPHGPIARIGGSMLSGGPVVGNSTCAGVWDENFVFYLSSCP